MADESVSVSFEGDPAFDDNADKSEPVHPFTEASDPAPQGEAPEFKDDATSVSFKVTDVQPTPEAANADKPPAESVVVDPPKPVEPTPPKSNVQSAREHLLSALEFLDSTLEEA